MKELISYAIILGFFIIFFYMFYEITDFLIVVWNYSVKKADLNNLVSFVGNSKQLKSVNH